MLRPTAQGAIDTRAGQAMSNANGNRAAGHAHSARTLRGTAAFCGRHEDELIGACPPEVAVRLTTACLTRRRALPGRANDRA
ncbi:hypothetical protein MTO96_006929 [Rhipicephalus appendiculatus]